MKGMTSKEAKLRRKNMDFSTFNKLSKSPASFKANHARFDIYSEVKSNDTETSKPTAAVSTNTENHIQNHSETDNYDSVGGTLSDGLNSMKMYPILSNYQEIDSINRHYLWKMFLENNQNDAKIVLWEDESSKTTLNKLKANTIINSDRELLSTLWNLENQSVITMDITRTRNPIAKHKKLAEKCITLFCKSHKISYKQGLNEIISPFISLYKQKEELDDFQIYNWFVRFMHAFLPTFYNDSDFLSLQCSLGLFELLLKYHDPEVALFLRNFKISSDIYAFNWFITLFASKLPLDLVYSLWDFIIQEGDWMIIFYISTAFVMYHRQEILTSEEYILPQTMTNLTLKSKEEVFNIFVRALELRK